MMRKRKKGLFILGFLLVALPIVGFGLSLSGKQGSEQEAEAARVGDALAVA